MYRLEISQAFVEGKWYTVYGIAWDTGAIRNITVDRQRMESFIGCCIRCGISPEALPEAVDAFIE